MRAITSKSKRADAPPRVGLFGKLGAGNIGNDASMESVLNYLRTSHPDAIVDAMCTGPAEVSSRYGIDAIPVFWHHKFEEPTSSVYGIALKVLGKGIDVFRTASWARRHDAVIIPGAGVLEASLPLLPRGFPYSMFLVCASGKLFGTKVALVNVGAGAVKQRTTRWLFNSAARLAYFRSYRDPGAREAMRKRGLDVSKDHVYPDLAFALPAPPYEAGDPQTVCLGVMAYYGTNDDRQHADEIYATYVAGMKRFVRWLVDDGRRVRLLVGDTNGSDDGVVQEILADMAAYRPDLDPSTVMPEKVASFADVMEVMQPVGSVVAIRYHNILCAVRLCKPTISIGYSPKHDVLMTDMGLDDFREAVSSLDVDELIQRFIELETRSADLRQKMMARNATKGEQLEEGFAELSAALFLRPKKTVVVLDEALVGTAG